MKIEYYNLMEYMKIKNGKKVIFLIDKNGHPLSYSRDDRDLMVEDLLERFTSEEWNISSTFEDPTDKTSHIEFLILTPKI